MPQGRGRREVREARGAAAAEEVRGGAGVHRQGLAGQRQHPPLRRRADGCQDRADGGCHVDGDCPCGHGPHPTGRYRGQHLLRRPGRGLRGVEQRERWGCAGRRHTRPGLELRGVGAALPHATRRDSAGEGGVQGLGDRPRQLQGGARDRGASGEVAGIHEGARLRAHVRATAHAGARGLGQDARGVAVRRERGHHAGGRSRRVYVHPLSGRGRGVSQGHRADQVRAEGESHQQVEGAKGLDIDVDGRRGQRGGEEGLRREAPQKVKDIEEKRHRR
mmetsp:Transcript_115940/g.334804  ORF Transcript_115940/g.334804 Transcript_115940/m.334804 type:complete len:276 (-) Transcript_115940:1459-2286(-)